MNLPPPSTIFESLRYFRAYSLFCDVRLRYPDSLEFLAHRVIVAAASPYFRDRLAGHDGIQMIPMPVECPSEVIAFVLAWLYHEPTKLELSDEPGNLEFLMKLKQGAEFLGIDELQSHVDVILSNIHGVAKQEPEDDDDDGQRSYAQQTSDALEPSDALVLFDKPLENRIPPPPSQPRRRGRPPKKRGEPTANPKEKHLVVELERMLGNEEAEPPADAADDDDDDNGVDESTHDSGVGELPEEANDNAVVEGGVQIKTENETEGGEDREKKVVRKTVIKKAPTTATTTVKRRKKKKFLFSNPPCPQKQREKKLKEIEERVKEKETKDKELIKCEFCPKEMVRGKLRRHIHNSHRYNMWKKKNGPINDPTLIEHLNERGFECKRCGFVILKEAKKWEREAAKHLYKTHNILCKTMGFACSHEGCCSVQWTETRLAKHEMEKHIQPRRRVKCPVCDKTLFETSLKAHMEDLHATKPFEHLCDLCGRGFASKSKVRAHERFAHFQKGVFNCDRCDDDKPFKTTSRESLLHHQYYLHDVLQPGSVLYSCDQCDFKTPVKFNINRHVKRKHEPLTPYPCPECGKTFNRSSFLEAHITRVHRSGESHPCDECEAVFRSAAGLRYHRWKFHRTGSNGPQKDDPNHWFEKPYMCGYCSHTSGLQGNLKKHIVNMHKEMPMKVIDLRKARRESKTARGSKEKGGEPNREYGDAPAANESVTPPVSDISEPVRDVGDSPKYRDLDSESTGPDDGGLVDGLGGLPVGLESERMKEISERMEYGVDMRRINMIVNQMANRMPS